MRGIVMTDGDAISHRIPDEQLLEEYYICLHGAYNAMRIAFEESGLVQDQLAERLGIDKSLVSRRLNGTENLTLKTLSYMGTAMGYRPMISYTPFDQLGMGNYFISTPLHTVPAGTVITMNVGAQRNIPPEGVTAATVPAPAMQSGVLVSSSFRYGT
jgi:hypothetical protein